MEVAAAYVPPVEFPGEPVSAHRVAFTPSGRQGRVVDGTTVLDAARQLGVDLDSVCGGRGVCGRCQVVPGYGAFPAWGMSVEEDHLDDPGGIEQHYTERQYRGRRPLTEGRRLGCALRIHGDVLLDVPAASQLHRQVVRKDVAIDGLILDPLVSLRYVTPADGGDADQRSAWQRIRDELAAAFGLTDLDVAARVLPRLHAAVRDAAGLTVAIRDDEVVAVWPGFVDRVAGVAVDVGSTTLAGHLCDLTTGEVLATAGRMNPQIRFGEDLMSRVSYAMLHEDGAQQLTAAVRAAIDELIGELALDAQLSRERVLELVLVGNPVMHHLVLGVDPTPLGQAPFTLATHEPVTVAAEQLDLDAAAGRVYLAPCIAGHVGADTAAVILNERPDERDEVTLIVDVGTNAEIVLGNRDGLFAASSPTGPAFEGAQISAGQRATTGAIERVRIDRETLAPRFTVIGCELWSDHPDFGAAAARSGVTGICGSGIVEVVSELFLSGVIDPQGVIRPELAERTDRVVADGRTAAYVLHRGSSELRITQNDVRAIQLAKAALRAGIDLLLAHAGLVAPDRIRLAGAFGAHIDPLHAMVLGLVPDAPLTNVAAVGNAAGSGALRALLSRAERDRLESVVSQVTKIETATEPQFQELFVAALAFPHSHAPTPLLAEQVDLPALDGPASARTETPGSTSTSGRRRRRPGRGSGPSAVAAPDGPGPAAGPGPGTGPGPVHDSVADQEVAP